MLAKGAKALLGTAEKLFSQYGPDGVSRRQIASTAREANASAIHPHFGSKTGLIHAIYEMRAPVVEAARQAQIDMMDRGDRHSFEDVLTAMLMPIIHVFSARDRMLYARFMMRLLPLDEDEIGRAHV